MLLDDINVLHFRRSPSRRRSRTGLARPLQVRQEARILATLRHPYIVAYKGQMTRPSWGLLVQFCPKGSLRDRIRWHQVHGYVRLTVLVPRALTRHCCNTWIRADYFSQHRSICLRSQYCDAGEHHPQGALAKPLGPSSPTYGHRRQAWRSPSCSEPGEA